MSEKCTTDFDVSGMSCSACQAAVERAVKKAGADDVSVNLLSGRMKVTHSDALSLEAIMEAVNAAGYHAEPHDASQLTKAPQESAEEVNKRHRIVSSVILLIPLMIVNALADQPLPVYGTGENVRDWLYVEDHCRAIDLILHEGRSGEVYNVGGHNEMRNIDVVKLICKELDRPESLITFVADRKGHDMRYAIDAAKIRNELGWMPETTFRDGIRRTVRWYLDHREWWQEIVSGEYQSYCRRMYGDR